MVALAPLPLGSVYQWSWAGIAVVVGILLLAWSLRVAIVPAGLAFGPGRLWFPGLLYLLVAAWVAAQGADLTPSSWHHPIWTEAAEVLGVETAGSISLDPYATRSGLLMLLTYGGVFWLAAQYGRDRARARAAVWVLGSAGALYAVYGLIAGLSGSGKLLWFDGAAQGSVTGTFVNRNMYAFYAGLGFLCAAALLMERGLPLLERHFSGGTAPARPERSRANELLVLLAMTTALVLAIVFTESRGGAVSSATSFGVLFVCLIRPAKFGGRRSLRWVIGGFLLVGVLVYAITGAQLGERIAGQFFESDGRLHGYEIGLRALADAPLRGFGQGTFAQVFYLYHDGGTWKNINYAHNLYLGTAVELGIPAAAVLLLSAASVAFACARGLAIRGRDHVFPALGVAATLLVAVHGSMESPLHVPANAVTYSFLLGVAYGQSWSTRPSALSRSAVEPPHRSDRGHPARNGAQSE